MTSTALWIHRSVMPVTANTPPTTAQTRARKCPKDAGASLTSITTGDRSYRKNTAGKPVSDQPREGVKYSVTEYRFVRTAPKLFFSASEFSSVFFF